MTWNIYVLTYICLLDYSCIINIEYNGCSHYYTGKCYHRCKEAEVCNDPPTRPCHICQCLIYTGSDDLTLLYTRLSSQKDQRMMVSLFICVGSFLLSEYSRFWRFFFPSTTVLSTLCYYIETGRHFCFDSIFSK